MPVGNGGKRPYQVKEAEFLGWAIGKDTEWHRCVALRSVKIQGMNGKTSHIHGLEGPMSLRRQHFPN